MPGSPTLTGFQDQRPTVEHPYRKMAMRPRFELGIPFEGYYALAVRCNSTLPSHRGTRSRIRTETVFRLKKVSPASWTKRAHKLGTPGQIRTDNASKEANAPKAFPSPLRHWGTFDCQRTLECRRRVELLNYGFADRTLTDWVPAYLVGDKGLEPLRFPTLS